MEHWMTWDPCEGWTEHATEDEARELYDAAIQDAREASADGWPEHAERIGLWRLEPVVTVALVQTATSEDDTDEGARCRSHGWDYIAEAVETEHLDEVAALRAEVERLTIERDMLRDAVRVLAERLTKRPAVPAREPQFAAVIGWDADAESATWGFGDTRDAAAIEAATEYRENVVLAGDDEPRVMCAICYESPVWRTDASGDDHVDGCAAEWRVDVAVLTEGVRIAGAWELSPATTDGGAA